MMHVKFGKTEARDFPARGDKPASTGWEQKGWIMEPGQDGEPDTAKPFTVMHRNEGDAYIIGEIYALSAAHLEVNRYGRMEFNPYARFQLFDPDKGVKDKPLSVQAAAQAPRAA